MPALNRKQRDALARQKDAPTPRPLTVCAAQHNDGECVNAACVQLRDGEPAKTGRGCPLPWVEYE